MKNLLLAAALGLATAAYAAPQAPQSQDPQTPAKSEKEIKRARKAARREKGPDVYKGNVANQRRLITEAEGAEKERDTDDESVLKKQTKKPGKD